MKKMDIRKITAMAAALVMCLSISSCGDLNSTMNGNAAEEKADRTKAAMVKGDTAEKTAAADDAADGFTAGASDEITAGAAAEAADGGEYFGEIDMDAAFKADGKTSMEAEGIMGDTADAGDARTDIIEEPVPGDDSGDDIIENPGEAFVLTAGEWNDNDNWGFFTNLAKNGTISYPVFGLDPTHRIAVTVTKEGEPALNQPVELLDSEGNVIWTARTNKDGMAYVFYKTEQKPAQVKCGDATREVTGDSNDEQGNAGTSEAALEVTDSKKADDTQVMFILDTTGSMYDEIAYLQMDFSSIAKEVDDGHTSFSVNFYRDEGDEYVTKCNPFSTDVKSVQSAINQECADGGGDLPEAVAEILEETITSNDQWSEDANKIAFLIFDAPPHKGKEYKLEAAVKTAAEKGIHLVPVVASGSDRDTELFGRAIAAQTGSNYVFLTDDSGVGGSHLEPIIGDYEVELLHDVIVRNITELRG